MSRRFGKNVPHHDSQDNKEHSQESRGIKPLSEKQAGHKGNQGYTDAGPNSIGDTYRDHAKRSLCPLHAGKVAITNSPCWADGNRTPVKVCILGKVLHRKGGIGVRYSGISIIGVISQ